MIDVLNDLKIILSKKDYTEQLSVKLSNLKILREWREKNFVVDLLVDLKSTLKNWATERVN